MPIRRTLRYLARRNPTLLHLPLSGSLSGTDRNGAVAATGSGALRYLPAQGARINYALNPRFANDTATWTTQISGTLTRIAGDGMISAACAEVTIIASSGSGLVSGNAPASTATVPDGGGAVYTVSAAMKLVSGGPDVALGVLFKRADGSTISSQTVRCTLTGSWVRYSGTGTLPAGTTKLGVAAVCPGTTPAAGTFRITEIVLERGSTALPYFDGSSGAPACWLDPVTGQLGTAHASPSVSAAAALVEEATTNLLLNPSGENATITTGTIVWSGATVTRDTAYAYQGTAAVKVVTPGATINEGVSFTSASALNYTGSVRTFVGSIWLRGSGSVDVWLRAQYTDTSTTDGARTTVVLTDAWQAVAVATIATNAAKTVNLFHLFVRTTGTLATTFYADAAQVEEKGYATSYCDGSLGTGYTWSGTAHASSSSRAATTVKIDETAHVDPVRGGIAVWVQRKALVPGLHYILQVGDGTAGKDFIGIRPNGNGQVAAFISNAGATVQVGGYGIAAETWVAEDVRWDRRAVGFNQEPLGNSATLRDEPQGNISTATDLAIGSHSGGTAQFGGGIGPVWILDRPLTSRARMRLLALGPNAGFDGPIELTPI